MLGTLGLTVELWNPGSILPGVEFRTFLVKSIDWVRQVIEFKKLYQSRLIGYESKTGSLLMIGICSVIACAINIRSNGSLWWAGRCPNINQDGLNTQG
jgi:hypothetical protein